jgi:4-methyl-5(b-hydroxyethyl)-thiazole monophosphate biosynthesis
MTKSVIIPISNGFEEIEACTVVDVLRRGGVEVTFCGLGDGDVTGRSNITVKPDCTLDQALKQEYWDMIVLPGGMPNAYNLADDPRVIKLIQSVAANDGITAAICAAPKTLDVAGVLKGKKATNYPGMKDDIASAQFCEDAVVDEGKVVTSRGPGTAMEFALALLEKLVGKATAQEVGKALLVR